MRHQQRSRSGQRAGLDPLTEAQHVLSSIEPVAGDRMPVRAELPGLVPSPKSHLRNAEQLRRFLDRDDVRRSKLRAPSCARLHGQPYTGLNASQQRPRLHPHMSAGGMTFKGSHRPDANALVALDLFVVQFGAADAGTVPLPYPLLRIGKTSGRR